MLAEQLRAIMDYLRSKVSLEPPKTDCPINTTFQAPTDQGMVAAGLNAGGVKRLLGVPWWAEMVEDIVETPEMCGLEVGPGQVLEFAQDVVSEYIRKQFPLNEE